MTYTAEVKNIPEGETIIYLDHKGPYQNIGPVFQKLFEIAMANNLVNMQSRTFGIYYDDPCNSKPEDLRSRACIAVAKDAKAVEGLQLGTLPVGKYVTMLHKGPYEQLMPAYEYLYVTWPAENNAQIDVTSPAIEEYLNSPEMVAPEELETVIYVPLA